MSEPVLELQAQPRTELAWLRTRRKHQVAWQLEPGSSPATFTARSSGPPYVTVTITKNAGTCVHETTWTVAWRWSFDGGTGSVVVRWLDRAEEIAAGLLCVNSSPVVRGTGLLMAARC